MDKQSRHVVILASAILLIFVILTIRRNYEWTSEQELWAANVRTCPTCLRARLNLAREHDRNGNKQQAFNLYRDVMKDAALRMKDPTTNVVMERDILATAQSDMGVLLLNTGNTEMGEKMLYASMSLEPNFGASVLALARLYNAQNRPTDVLNVVDPALAQGFGPGFQAFNGEVTAEKGIALCHLGYQEIANQHFRRADKQLSHQSAVCVGGEVHVMSNIHENTLNSSGSIH